MVKTVKNSKKSPLRLKIWKELQNNMKIFCFLTTHSATKKSSMVILKLTVISFWKMTKWWKIFTHFRTNSLRFKNCHTKLWDLSLKHSVKLKINKDKLLWFLLVVKWLGKIWNAFQKLDLYFKKWYLKNKNFRLLPSKIMQMDNLWVVKWSL